ncbi:MAG: flagellar hook basal-body protein [Candidatus Dadabacteria bacterium]|nr:MAG: flagellar hook basal-body protein [Candidatus Dadabacteria bacterium]
MLNELRQIGRNLTLLNRLVDVRAQNIANASTSGYLAHRLALSVGDTDAGGAPTVRPYTSGEAGPVTADDQPLHVALAPRSFLRVETPAGIRLSRAGDLSVDREGRLVDGEGAPVLAGGAPLLVGAGEITIQDNGTVLESGVPVGRLDLVEADNPRPLGQRHFAEPDDVRPGGKLLATGALTGANVDPLQEMVGLMRDGDLHRRLIQMTRMLEQVDQTAIETFGRGV